MQKLFFSILIAILFIQLPIYSNLKKGKEKYDPAPKKAKPDLKKENCCEIDSDFDNSVRLKRICLKEGMTSIQIKFLTPTSACTILENITLRDNAGNKYKPLGSEGIPDCPKSELRRPGDSFLWNFEKINSGIKSITLSESEVDSLSAWKWENVDISHCKF